MKRRSGRIFPAARVRGAARTSARGKEASPALQRTFWRILICGTIFVSLVALKLITPNNLSDMRGTLGAWLVRDADFKAAFSALGQTVSGEGGVADKLGQAYIAVFGEKESDATEVSGDAQISAASPTASDDNADAQQGEERTGGEEVSDHDDRADPEEDSSAADEADGEDGVEKNAPGFPFQAPLSGTVTSPFGWREHPTSGREAFHYGADIAAQEGERIGCFADGVVGVVGESTELGRYLTVTHEDGYSTLYAHCSRILVNSGSTVRCGEAVAEVGQTGNATGPHLHFEIHKGGEYLDPEPFLAA